MLKLIVESYKTIADAATGSYNRVLSASVRSVFFFK